tara:strand:- start:23 stop:412 length:390 start_codon:yes stop_codon:yes gene_type:complete
MNCQTCGKGINISKFANKLCKCCYNREWRENNRENLKKYRRQYRLDNFEHLTIKNWIKMGLIELEGVYTYQSLFEYYSSITHCEVCENKIENSFDKCLDHCHTTHLFRWVLCRSCNYKDKWVEKYDKLN